MKKILALLLLVALAGGGYLLASPWFVAGAIEEAIRQNDADALEAHVDFPTLRENLKGRLGAAMTGDGGGGDDAEAGGVAKFLGGLAAGLAGKMVDAFVTPENLAAMARTDGRAEGEGLFADADRAYEGFGRFTVTVREPDDADAKGEPQLVLVLERQGLRWRMTDVRFPEGGGK